MAATSGFVYPPTMPLYADRVRHSRVNEDVWAAPIPFMPFLILTTILFILGLSAIYAIHTQGWTIGPLSTKMTMLLASTLPALILILVMVIGPRASSPAWAYQIELFRTPDDNRLRWNLAVVSTANIYCSSIAQSEWLSLLPTLSEKERFRALDYIRVVVRRLQRVPLCWGKDIMAMLLAGGLVLITSLVAFRYNLVEAILHSIALLVLLQLFLLYMFLQRWQHTRRLLELEEVFEELLPSARPAEDTPAEPDEVETWYQEHQKLKITPAQPEAPQLPKAPWE